MADGDNEGVLSFGDKVRLVRSAFRSDGWANLITGLGTSRDKATGTKFVAGYRLSDDEAETLYAEDDMAARIADVVPDEMLRRGYGINVTSQEDLDRRAAALGAMPDTTLADPTDAQTLSQINAADAALIAENVKDHANRLELQSKFVEAMVWARVYGWGGILLGVDDGARGPQLAEPLNTENIRTFDYMNVLDKRFVWVKEWYTEPTEPNAGKPKTYLVTPNATNTVAAAQSLVGTLEVHESRMITFAGARTPIRRRQRQNGFHDSVFQRVNTVLTQFGATWGGLSTLLQDAQQGVYKMQGFIDMLASRDTAAVMRRLELMDISRSISRSVVLDAEMEDFERQDFNFGGVDKIVELFMLRLAAAARVPATVLMSQSPAGMDATGESDLKWFYDTIDTARENDLKPVLARALELMMLAKAGPTDGMVPPSWNVTFPEMVTPTPAESAKIRAEQATADQIYHVMGAVTADEIALSRFPADGWSPDTNIDLAARRMAEEVDADLELGTEDPEAEPSTEIAKMGLNAQQITAMTDIVTLYQSGDLERAQAVEMLVQSLPSISPESANTILGPEPDEAEIERRREAAKPPPMVPGEDPEPDDDGDPEPDKG